MGGPDSSILLGKTEEMKKSCKNDNKDNIRIKFTVISFFSSHFKEIVSRDWEKLQMVLLDRSEVCTIGLDVYFFYKSLTYLKFQKYSAGRYHIYAPCHWVEVMCSGATARAGDFFALAVRSPPTVLIGRFSDGGMQCTSGWLIQGCSYTLARHAHPEMRLVNVIPPSTVFIKFQKC
jgi:hypothetical protein